MVMEQKYNCLKNLLYGSKSTDKKFLFPFLFLLLSFQLSLAQTTVSFTTTGSQTWTAPCGVTSVTVEAWGGGGAGGGTSANNRRGGGGGAGGTYASSTLTVTPGTTYNLFVGNGATGTQSAGGTGQASWFLNTSTLYAQGGAGGAEPNNTTVAGGTGSTASSIGTTLIAGADGANGTTTIGGAGGAGGNGGGAGGNQRTNEGNGNNGNAPGGGGGGAFVPDNTNHSGGDGARGEIRITYTSPFQTYCTPSYSSSTSMVNVTYAGINNTTGNTAVGGEATYYSYCDMASVIPGTTDPISVRCRTYGANQFDVRAFIDWNQDGDFADANETYYIGHINSTADTQITLNSSITVPVVATPGLTRMRVMYHFSGDPTDPCYNGFGYGQIEDYSVNIASTLACSGNPQSLTVSNITQTSADVSWTEPSPAPANGYDYYVSISSTPPTSGTIPTGSTPFGVTTVNLTGLIADTTYYVWIRSDCGGTDGEGVWIRVTFITPDCTTGTGTGTTTLGCPSVISGGLSLNGADPAPFFCTDTSTCVDLEATYLNLGDTSTYTVESIPFLPPYQFGCLQNQVDITVDDTWSSTVNLPFDFCFYGNSYNQCLVGSNGLITFDLASNTPGGTCNWQFNNNIPISGDPALVENSIFGVFLDIDPSEGGEIGWELITLNTGCRALVASWKDVPMYSCTSQLYTGMIVLYENTNVIEVYIQEKNDCAGWNNGNAVVGIQNATGTIGTVAPNRNGLDPNWTTTNEAWRFVPSGNSITTITWYEGSGTTGPVVGTTDVINVCPTATTTYTAAITYTLCDGSTLTETDEATVTVNGAKVWNGSINTDWNDDNNWTPIGKPTALDCVVIPNTANDPIISGSGYNGLGLNLTVQNDALLTVNSNNSVTITDWVNVNATGDILLNSSASLIQTNNVANTGNIHMLRNVDIRKLDYVYWASPVNSFSVGSVSPSTTGNRYKWIPTIASNLNGYGNWASTSESMITGKGYIVRGPDNYTSTLQTFTANFNGTPNNGDITMSVLRGSYDGADYNTGSSMTLATKEDDNWNLIGNPYPSSIDAVSFLASNPNIDGFIKLWTHGTLPSSATTDPYYQDYTYNYTTGDYITYNSTGTSSGPGVFGGYIAAGQGFFVLMNHSGTTSSENVTFTNSMRAPAYDNSQFFRNSNTGRSATNLSTEGKIWLDLIEPNGENVRTLVGYIDNATNSRDRLFDAISNEKLALNFYSLIGDETMTIQGKAAPFNDNDTVPLGVKVSQNGSHAIAIGAVEGLFEDANQEIYLEDLSLGIIHDLRYSPYNFTSPAGTFNDRFVLRYTNQTLGNDSFYNSNYLNVYSNENIIIESSLNIKSVTVHDVLGRLLFRKSEFSNKQSISINSITKSNNPLIVTIETEDGNKTSKKIMF